MEFVEIEWQSSLYAQEVELRERLLRAPLGLTFTPEELQAEQAEQHFGVATDGKLIACLVVVPLQPAHAKIRQMCVRETHQRQGIGARLMNQTEAALMERGTESVELSARETAVGFYQKLGYETVGDGFIEVSIPHFKMAKRLGTLVL